MFSQIKSLCFGQEDQIFVLFHQFSFVYIYYEIVLKVQIKNGKKA